MSRKRIPLYKRIVFKIPLLIVVVLVIGLGFMSTFFAKVQIDTVYNSHEVAITDIADILYRSIKSNMIAGEAKIAVNLIRELTQSDSSSIIRIYDINGKSAFSTNNTIQAVNSYLNEDRFIPKDMLAEDNTIFHREKFQESIIHVDDVIDYNTIDGDYRVEIYKPLINQPKCNTCHGVDHVVRGVIYVSHSLGAEQQTSKKTQQFSILFFAVMVTVLTTTIIIFLRRVVIRRIIRIGAVVEHIGSGSFDQKIKIVRDDEIGRLGSEINKMIDGLKEKFRLTKFVSKSTLEYVKNDNEVVLGGSKETVTVMFTDIRGFTNYSESREPEEVLDALNRLMNLQVDVISEFGGDIDKFVGDEIMAIYTGEDMALRAVQTALKIKEKIRNFDRGDRKPFYIGIGINTGEVILGNMGSHARIDRTVIGDTVNLGARLCSVAGKNTIVLSAKTWELVADKTECVKQPPFTVKGKNEAITAYILKGFKQ